MERCDILIVGAGAAGIAAAKAAAKSGCDSVLLVDRKQKLGGILLQCAHYGFGAGLNGPQYAEEMLLDFPETVRCCLNTTVLSVSAEREALLASPEFGRKTVHFQQLILASGCLETPIGALPVAGTRPAGIYTAGQMQEMMNLHGYMPEGPVVILGSGDIGLVMARQLAEAGLSVSMVEQNAVCGGLLRNQKCLTEFPIALHCSTTVTEVAGERHLEGVRLSDGEYLPCRTLLVAAGLRPDRNLVYGMENVPWLTLCGNCNTVHPMVEGVINEGSRAGKTACERICGNL